MEGSVRSGWPITILLCVGHQHDSPFPPVSPEDNQDRMVCKEIRHNSTGCLRMKDQCDKCQEILSVGESGSPGSLVPHWGSLCGVRHMGLEIPLCCLLAVALGMVLGPAPPGPLICRHELRWRAVPEIGRQHSLISPVIFFPRARPGRPPHFPLQMMEL